jgi:hypothetical protein
MNFSKGTVYRTGVSIKELGERIAHIRILGIPALAWASGPVIALGLIIKDSILGCPVGEM